MDKKSSRSTNNNINHTVQKYTFIPEFKYQCVYTKNIKANVKNGLMKAKQRHTSTAVSSLFHDSKNYAQEKILTHSDEN